MISCAQYDAIEIVCMYFYPIKLTFKSGEVLNCKALDTQRNANGEECIKVKTESSDSLVVLTSIWTLEICVENPHFKIISFI
ncbi:transcriptional regulator [Marinomonas ushuaiensis DSM 15871]|uniref:Transcriptional regulator n=1 Tax=Marinomonas ushuaiensis DSM 15871 TaxID=1122207 RepID=X7E3V8_9GAMM|nr:Rho-binding antiterminator [Marinomonas ushuaiensis]ETX10642.1 transcriptional regulator [Marinomonas ushuaiensis DSM 15871]